MLDKFKKTFGLASKPSETLETITEETTMADTTAASQVAQLTEVVTAQAATLQELKDTVTSLSEKYGAAQTELAAIAAQKQLDAETAATARLEARKTSLTKALGTVKADALLASLESLDDATFNTVVSTMSAGLDAEGNTAAFTEAGVTVETTQSAQEQVTHFNQYTKDKE